MDCLYGTVVWSDGAYLLVRQDAAHGFRLLPARIGSPVDGQRVTAELAAHGNVWIPHGTILFRTLGDPDGSGIQGITLLRPDAKIPSLKVDILADPPPVTSLWWGVILGFAILGLLGHRQAQAQAHLPYRSTLGRLLDIRRPSLFGLAGSFLRQTVGYRPGDWRSVEPTPDRPPGHPHPPGAIADSTGKDSAHAIPPAP